MLTTTTPPNNSNQSQGNATTNSSSSSTTPPYMAMGIFRDRIQQLVTFEQILANSLLNYSVESYGKWHVFPSLYVVVEAASERASEDTIAAAGTL